MSRLCQLKITSTGLSFIRMSKNQQLFFLFLLLIYSVLKASLYHQELVRIYYFTTLFFNIKIFFWVFYTFNSLLGDTSLHKPNKISEYIFWRKD